MVKKCEAKYKNLNLIQSFSEQGYATVQWANQNCMNDEWLRQEVEKLGYLTPPAIRKSNRANESIDETKSWGYNINGDGTISFSTKTEDTLTVDFTQDTLQYIDLSPKTTVKIVSNVAGLPDLAENEIFEETDGVDSGTLQNICRLPLHEEIVSEDAVYDTTTKNYTEGDKLDSSWYVGFNKSKNYYVRPDWLKNWRDVEIPSVWRGQTFKAKKTGVLESIHIPLEYNGSYTNSNAGSPLYIQIWSTHKKFKPKTYWDNKTHKAKYNYLHYTNDLNSAQKELYQNYARYEQNSKGVWQKKTNGNYVIERESIAWLGEKNAFNENGKLNKTDARYHPLAQAKYDPQKYDAKSMFPEIIFDKPCEVKKGYSYAIILASPLSEWKHCPRWCGWSRTKKDNKYADGNAFYSETNGWSWKRYGVNDVDKKVKNRANNYSPQDFAFICNIRVKNASQNLEWYYEEGEYYLYLKPIHTNPLKQVRITGTETGDVDGQNIHVRYEFSTDNGKTWTIGDNTYKTVNKSSDVLRVRAVLSRDNGDAHKHKTPILQSITVDWKCDLPTEMYVRTKPCTPNLGEIMGASLWGRVYAPYILDNSDTECSVEIIEDGDTFPNDHFTILDISQVAEKIIDLSVIDDNLDYTKVIESYNGETGEYIVKSDDDMLSYLVDHTDVIEVLKKHDCYIKPVILNNNNLCLFSFATDNEEMVIAPDNTTGLYLDSEGEDISIGGIKFNNSVAGPIIECGLDSGGEGRANYVEWIDYIFDYDNNELIFTLDSLLEMLGGDLEVKYNRVFIEGLTNDEVGLHKNLDTGLEEEGLIIDYFKETINIDASIVETRKVPLRTAPVDPIRSVILNKDTDDERVCYENRDYTVNASTNELEFEIVDKTNSTSILTDGDELTVVYTPNLNCNAISIGYHAKRTEIGKQNNKQVYIKDNYIEYKI